MPSARVSAGCSVRLGAKEVNKPKSLLSKSYSLVGRDLGGKEPAPLAPSRSSRERAEKLEQSRLRPGEQVSGTHEGGEWAGASRPGPGARNCCWCPEATAGLEAGERPLPGEERTGPRRARGGCHSSDNTGWGSSLGGGNRNTPLLSTKVPHKLYSAGYMGAYLL